MSSSPVLGKQAQQNHINHQNRQSQCQLMKGGMSRKMVMITQWLHHQEKMNRWWQEVQIQWTMHMLLLMDTFLPEILEKKLHPFWLDAHLKLCQTVDWLRIQMSVRSIIPWVTLYKDLKRRVQKVLLRQNIVFLISAFLHPQKDRICTIPPTTMANFKHRQPLSTLLQKMFIMSLVKHFLTWYTMSLEEMKKMLTTPWTWQKVKRLQHLHSLSKHTIP